jgi:voltage-gated potassium channel
MSNRSEFGIRRRVHELLEPAKGEDRASRVVDTVIGFMIGLAVLSICLESVPEWGAAYRSQFVFIETLTVIFFTIEYVLRIWSAPGGSRLSPWLLRRRYVMSFYGIVDLISIIPYYLPFILPGIDLRFLRVLRMLRILKVSHYNSALEDLIQAIYDERKSFFSAAYILAVAILLSSSLAYYAEHTAQPEEFRSIPHAIWWSIITLTTVGYGDVSPVTLFGKIIGVFTALAGVCTVALLTGIVANSFAAQMARKRALFEAAVLKALQDGEITSAETSTLHRLSDEFNMTPEHANAILARIKQELFDLENLPKK